MKDDVLIFRAEVGLSEHELEKLHDNIVNQLDLGGVVVLPSHVSLVDIRESEDGHHEIGYK